MRTSLTIIACLLLPVLSKAQQDLTDSLRAILVNAKEDSVIYETTNQLYDYYEELNRDSAFFYADRCVQISKKNNKKINEAYSLSRKAYQEVNMGRFAEALHSLLDAFAISEKAGNENTIGWQDHSGTNHKKDFMHSCTHHIFGILMTETQNIEQQIIHFKEAKRIADEINNPARSLLGVLTLAGSIWKPADLILPCFMRTREKKLRESQVVKNIFQPSFYSRAGYI